MNEIKIEEQFSKRRLPINITDKDLFLFENELEYYNKPRNILFLNDCEILKDVIYKRGTNKFYDTFCYVNKRSYYKIRSRLIYLFHPSIKIDNAIWIMDDWSKEYFHWFTDALPRLIASEKYLNNHVILIPKKIEKKYRYIKESLSYFKINYFFYETKKIKINNLILPSHTSLTGNYNSSLINNVRDRFIDCNIVTANKRIFLSRRKARMRKIINENEVIDILLKYDFEIHIFEDYSLKRQIEIMQNTKILVGLHGGGLTNMLFMPREGKVLELRNMNDTSHNCFFSLASDLNHYYYYIENEGNTTNTHIVDIKVNLIDFENALKKMFQDK